MPTAKKTVVISIRADVRDSVEAEELTDLIFDLLSLLRKNPHNSFWNNIIELPDTGEAVEVSGLLDYIPF